jgi:2-dehydro-3-deoxygalactonokinase
VVQPGTHSKWTLAAPASGGAMAIREFVTFMTGEVFAVLREHSILGRLASAGPRGDDASFALGVDRGLSGENGGDLLHQVFGARTLGLFDELPATGIEDYLSGILIGAEVRAGQRWASSRRATHTEVWLAGTPALCARYASALARAGWSSRSAPADVAARGLWRIALEAGLVRRAASG